MILETGETTVNNGIQGAGHHTGRLWPGIWGVRAATCSGGTDLRSDWEMSGVSLKPGGRFPAAPGLGVHVHVPTGGLGLPQELHPA